MRFTSVARCLVLWGTGSGAVSWGLAMHGALVASLLLLAAAAPVSANPVAYDEFTARVVDLTNVERVQAGLRPLTVHPSLAGAAQGYAEVLASTGCFGHDCGPVPEMSRRSEQAGYTDWAALGENIAGGMPTPEQVVAGWMASAGHRSNILNPTFTEIGVGLATGGQYGIYWAQAFGASF